MAMLSRDAIEALGFASVGECVQISSHANFYGIDRITLGSNIRIDDFCILSAGARGIYIGNHVHIAVYSSLIGSGRIFLSDFCNLSSHTSIYSSNDDYSGLAMTNPTVPTEYTNVEHADVYLGKHVIIGSGSIVLPGIRINEGVAIGAHSLVKQDCESFGIYAGNPARKIKDRKRNLLELEQKFVNSKI